MKLILLALGMALLLEVSGPAQAPSPVAPQGAPSSTAGGVFVDGEGRSIGEVRLQQTPHGVLVKIDLVNATPGIHALHFHKVGKCDRPSFESAGGHVEPAARQHGFLNPNGPHAGDLPNLDVPTTKRLAVEYVVVNVTLDRGSRSLLDADGSALVIHAGKDDYASDPAGNSGDRLACARIVAEGR